MSALREVVPFQNSCVKTYTKGLELGIGRLFTCSIRVMCAVSERKFRQYQQEIQY